MKRAALIAILIAAICFVLGSWRVTHSSPRTLVESPDARSTSARSTITPSPPLTNGATVSAKSPSTHDEISNADRPRFVSDAAPAQKRAGENDVVLQHAQQSVRDYRQTFQQNPVGTNFEITRTLLGKNPRGRRFLSSDARTNAKGELIDRWDQPLFFHQISAAQTEVRSAGPDHTMWTNDDEVLR